MRKKNKCPASCSQKLPLWAKKGMETGSDDDISKSSQDSVHPSDEKFSQDLHANVTEKIDSSHSTKLQMMGKKKDFLKRVTVMLSKMFTKLQ